MLAPPFLELSHSTIAMLQHQQNTNTTNNLDKTPVIDLDNVLTLWTTLANSAEFIRNGRRLENISWRVVNRSLLLDQSFNYNEFSTLLNISTSDSTGNGQPLTQRNLQRMERRRNQRQPTKNGIFYIKDSPSPDACSVEPSQLVNQKIKMNGQQRIQEMTDRPSDLVHPSQRTSLFSRVHPPEEPLVANHTLKPKQGPSDDLQMRHLYQQQLKYNGGNPHSPKSDTQQSQISLFATAKRPQAEKIMFSPSDDSSDGSDWSSMSDDSDFDVDNDEEGITDGRSRHHDGSLLFQKKEVGPSHLDSTPSTESLSSPQNGLRKSLLSGLFLNGKRANAPALSTPINQRQQRQIQQQRQQQPREQQQPQHLSSPKLLYSNGSPDSNHPTVRHVNSSDLSNVPKRATASKITVTTIVSKFSPPNNPRDLLRRHASSSSVVPVAPVATVTSVASVAPVAPVAPISSVSPVTPAAHTKSAVSLAAFFFNNRRPHVPAHGDVSSHVAPNSAADLNLDSGHYDRFHQSNAPPTATTLLPTALATHMFLPTMSLRQQARAKYGEPNWIRHRQERQRLLHDREYSFDGNEDSEYSSSVRTNTSSIDIPGSVLRTHLRVPSEKHSLNDQSLPSQRRQPRQASPHSERPMLGKCSSSSASRMSPKSTRIEMLSKELPLRLMDSINNENKLLFSKTSKEEGRLLTRLKRVNNGNETVYDSDLDGRENAPVDKKTSNSDEKDERNKGEDNDDDCNAENESNIIADGIMGNKLKLFHVRERNRQNRVGSPLLFNEDGFVNDQLVTSVLEHTDGNHDNNNNKMKNEWDDDNLNYHARGW
ncbi:hypothetical protein FOA43_003002 [Brettanomyces nanus]|uniref:Nitrogen regulatory protein areA GATA-like domain-containing protein n=1 Tax=Eeniella nana TaxID=13502 RepID=A0A875S5L4_EENNA|nr:uncharacterized protein FOA43_003002 [Brettanomyces nanus]QPG75645.1 hypothetical protein FOA43_003002 [Brettanomyces nanus]